MTRDNKKMMLEFRMDGDMLLLDYEKRTEKCSWSIFDPGGVERSCGILDGAPPHRIPVPGLSPNIYQLCVIDGDKLMNARFRINCL
jgi:hypothetical protein